LVEALKATTTRWAAAAQGSGGAGVLQLESGRPVVAVGGFTGGDPAPTLEEFTAMVSRGEVAYYVGGGMGRGGESGIAQWVTNTFTQTRIGDDTVYDLRRPLTATG
jgi:hypothetical protein